MESHEIKMIVYSLRDYYSRAEETEKVIMDCAFFAAAVDSVGSILPGLAIPATIISCFGAVWLMYSQLCDTLGISIKENVLKLLARAALANIAANLGGIFITMYAGMFIPGASIVISAAVTFITVYLAGIVFLQLILQMAKKSNDKYSFSDIGASEMKDTIKETKLNKDDIKAAKNIYEQNKK